MYNISKDNKKVKPQYMCLFIWTGRNAIPWKM